MECMFMLWVCVELVTLLGFISAINKLTPWSTLLPEKLTVTQLFKKHPIFYGTPRFISVFTKDRHWSLFRAR